MARKLSDEDQRLWSKVAQSIKTIHPFKSNKVDDKPSSLAADYKAATALKKTHPIKPLQPDHLFDQHPQPSVTFKPAGQPLKDRDHNWQKKLRRTKAPIDARLDLHGMTQDRAFKALSHFVMTAHERGHRSVLVITGKGSRAYQQKQKQEDPYYDLFPRDHGILRSVVPRWLNQTQLSRYIVSYYTANQEHGGEGALYVVLRNKNKGR